jgi:ACS family glucarate transporter-like MFS transporter
MSTDHSPQRHEISAATSGAKPSPYRWLVLTLCWAAFTMTSVDRSTWGPASASVGEALGVPLAALGVFATCYYIGYVVSNAGGGFLSDWLGSRVVLAVTSVVAGVLMFLFGSTTSLVMGLVIQGALGLFAGADYSAGIKLIASWFGPGQRGLAMGVFMTATSLGTVVANAIVPSLIAASGWERSYHVFGAVTIVIGLLCGLLLRTRPEGTATAATRTRAVPDLRPLFHNRNVFLLALGGFGGMWGTYGFVTWSNTLMTKANGISPVEAGIVVALYAGIAIGIKPVVGFVVDRLGIGNRIPMAVILAFFSAMLLLFGSMSSLTQFLWVAPLLGIGAYAYTPLMAAITPTLVEERLTGSTAGGLNAVWQLGSVIVPATVGPVFQATGSFYAAFLTLAAGPLLGAAAMLAIREKTA